MGNLGGGRDQREKPLEIPMEKTFQGGSPFSSCLRGGAPSSVRNPPPPASLLGRKTPPRGPLLAWREPSAGSLSMCRVGLGGRGSLARPSPLFLLLLFLQPLPGLPHPPPRLVPGRGEARPGPPPPSIPMKPGGGRRPDPPSAPPKILPPPQRPRLAGEAALRAIQSLQAHKGGAGWAAAPRPCPFSLWGGVAGPSRASPGPRGL